MKIILDSSCGLTKKEANKLGFGYVPLSVIVEGKRYLDGVDITLDEIAQAQKEGKDMSTSQPSKEAYIKEFGKYSKEDVVYYISLSKEISGSYDNALDASKDFANVNVIDSKHGGAFVIAVAEKIMQLVKNKIETSNVIKEVKSLIEKANCFFIIKDLKYLIKSGRISKKIAVFADMLGIKPILHFENGKIAKFGKTRSFEKGIKKIVNEWEKIKNTISEIAILVYKTDKELVDIAKSYFKEKLNLPIKTYNIPACVGVHVGPESIGITISKFK